MKESFKKVLRHVFYLILAVYVLSIPIGDQNLYFHARRILLENQLVALLDRHSSALYNQVTEELRLALLKVAKSKEKSTD